MKNRYTELRQRQQQEVNALPIGFAFSDRQFEEMMRGWGLDPETDLDKIYKAGNTGGFFKKSDTQLIRDTFSRHEKELPYSFVPVHFTSFIPVLFLSSDRSSAAAPPHR